MSRFKEKRRIDAAIAHKNKPELLWAKEYCQARLSTARRMHQKHWRHLLKKVTTTAEELD